MLRTEILTLIQWCYMSHGGIGAGKKTRSRSPSLCTADEMPNYDDYAWKKCGIGEWLKVTDPSTGQPTEKNISYPAADADQSGVVPQIPTTSTPSTRQRASKRCKHGACNF
jgi:hypothetical protein